MCSNPSLCLLSTEDKYLKYFELMMMMIFRLNKQRPCFFEVSKDFALLLVSPLLLEQFPAADEDRLRRFSFLISTSSEINLIRLY